MYQRDFENLLRSQPPHALLLYGDNPYLIDTYVQHYINITEASDSLLTQYFDEYHFQTAKNYLSQSSLFGGTNLLILKQDKKIPKKELDTLIEQVGKSPDNYLIYVYKGADKDAKSLQNSFSPKKGANWVRLFEPNINESLAILQKKANHLQIEIDRYALQHLLLLLNNNVALCANELTKLAILDGKVTAKEIDRLVYSTAPLAVEQLLTELFEKKPIVETLSRLLELGMDEFAILRSTQFFMNQIFLFHAYMKLHGNIDSKAILGYKLPKPIEQQKANLALRVKSQTILKLYEQLLELELQLKSTPTTNRELLLYGAFVRLQSYL
ncbi:MAG TPA: hypothetical protein ENK86_00220 [Campylobacterales bacterium]|nr:hypothetical protein [Campylobacterales bacterium]